MSMLYQPISKHLVLRCQLLTNVQCEVIHLLAPAIGGKACGWRTSPCLCICKEILNATIKAHSVPST